MTYIPQNPNGTAQPNASAPVTMAAQTIPGVARTAPVLNYEFLTNSASGWFDALAFSWMSCTIVTNASVSTGSLVFECTNDTTIAPNGISMIVEDSSLAAANRVNGSFALAASTVRQFSGPITTRYIRLRTAVAVSAGTVTSSITLKHTGPPMSSSSAALTGGFAAGTNTIGKATLYNSAVVNFGAVLLTTKTVTDVASAAITTTTLSPQVSLIDGPTAANFCIAVTGVSGTNPTLDIVVRESLDGTLYTDLYHFERITATGNYISPTLRMTGNYIKYNMAVGGTSPSFTPAIVRNSKSITGSTYRQYFNRTIVANIFGSTTTAYYSEGTTRIQMVANTVLSSGAACVIDLQGSDNGTDWFTLQSLTTVNGTAQLVNTACITKWIRGYTSTTNASQTINYVFFGALGPV